MTTVVRPATADRFDDVAVLLGGSGPRACWCLSYRLTPAEQGRATGRPERMRELLGGATAPGLLAYVDGEPAGWCGLGPRSQMSRLVRSRTIRPVDDLPVWSIVCFVVRAGYRRRGLARELLAGAVSYAAAHDAPAVEGYPIDPAGARVSTSLAYVGTTSMFEAAGFHRVRETSSHSAGLTRWLVRRDLTGR